MRVLSWRAETGRYQNFGDALSLELVRRIAGKHIQGATTSARPSAPSACVLAIGSILHYARPGDIVWGSGINGNHSNLARYQFSELDIRAVRGPLTAAFVRKRLGLECPDVFGDPALLLPHYFVEYARREPSRDVLIIPHWTERDYFSRKNENVMMPDGHPWHELLMEILCARLVIASSLHGIIVAEAFGVPVRMLRITEQEALLKYEDYFEGTGRSSFKYARSVSEAIALGGERRIDWDPRPLLNSFPKELRA